VNTSIKSNWHLKYRMSSYKKKEKRRELREELHKVQHETTKQLSSERERNDHAKKERDETKKSKKY